MRSVIRLWFRAKARVCPRCADPLRPEQPRSHRHRPQCWPFAQYGEAVIAFLEGWRPQP